MSDSIKREDSRNGAAAPVIAEVPAPVLPGVRGGGADTTSVIALRTADSAMSFGNMTPQESAAAVTLAGDAGDRRPDGDGDSAVRDLMASLPWASRVNESDSPLDAVLSAFGHDRRCRRRVRAGLAVTCECSTRQPVDDAAVAIFLALRFARIGLSRRLPLPHGIVEQLGRHVDGGDPAAVMVWDWLAGRGLVAARVLPRNTRQPALSLVCTEEKQ